MRMHRYGDLLSRAQPAAAAHIDGEGYVAVSRERQHRRVLLEAIGPGTHPCHWCGRSVSWDLSYPKDRDALVADHLDGVKTNNDPANLVPAHGRCNLARATRWGDRLAQVLAR
jgi:hypothetical protein